VRFEWDDAKHRHNLENRGFGFDLAASIFDGDAVEWPDDRRDYGELRFRAIGEADRLVLHVVFTDRGGSRRIISARLANRKERQRWRARA
jgi:uncharacterized DUF497 family protein